MGKTLIPEDFRISDEMRTWARFKVPGVDIDAQYELFCDYWRAHGKKMLDWNATFRNWLRRSPEFAPRAPVTRYSQMERPRALAAPTRTLAPPMQPREHPLFRKN
jgi:hypothetical protein